MNTHLNKLFALCLFIPTPLFAAWTGISFTLGDETIPLMSNSEELTLTPFQLSLAAEEKSIEGLRIGAHITKIELDINSATKTINAAADAIGVYLRLPFEVNQYIDIIPSISFTKTLANPNSELEGDIDYLTKKASLGLRLKWGSWRLTPTISTVSINGDFINTTTNTSFRFSEKQARYNSINIDYRVEQKNYIRLSLTEHTDNTFSVSFIAND